MKIDFMLIVLNGEPFINAWLKTYEPHANKIFVIEGVDNERFSQVHSSIREMCHTPDGHSIDNTREIVGAYPSDKIVFIDKNPKTGNGLWHSKSQMIKQVNDRVEGDWLWEADSDEFLFQRDIDKIKRTLSNNMDQKVWEFDVYNFWRSPRFILKGGWVSPYRRIFRWKPGETRFKEHRPPRTNMDGHPRRLPFPLFHYNYILEHDAKYKPAYHLGMYGKNWFENKWLAWTPETKDALEKNGIGPNGWGKTGTKQVSIEHPEFVAPVLTDLIKNGLILP